MWSPRYAIARDFDPPDKTLRDAVVAERSIGLHLDPVPDVRPIRFLLEAQRVAPRRQLGNAVQARRVGDHDLLALQIGRRRGHHHVGDRRVGLRIDDVSGQHRA